ncbi:MAG: type II toxin-antitoxin system RelE/ParE family toxin [Clostridiales Family XIII bacterium]|jgi:phage-related protein|nr:type II toxin-antitoxin system RelE/ParE family toxin [Clostridiales Family XIII bacterium]
MLVTEGEMLYKVITYKNRNGKDEVAEYINELNEKMGTNKDARIHYKKMMEYIGQLQTYGVVVGKPAIEHMTGTDLWELRPTNDRILFAYWTDNVFILLHHFTKKTQKTPPREIERAQRKLKDFIERYGN